MGIVAKYKFDHNTYADLVPVFNDGYTGYSINDEVAEDGSYTIRTIECDVLPTLMTFGGEVSDRCNSLLEVLDMDTSGLTNMLNMFWNCSSLTKINCDWIVDKVWNMQGAFSNCYALEDINTNGFQNSVATNIYALFQNCYKLKNIDIRGLVAANATIYNNVLLNCTSLNTLNIENLVFNTNASMETCFLGNSVKYIKCNIPSTIQLLSTMLPDRVQENPGTIIYQGAETLPQDTIATLQSKNWTVVTNPTLIAKYKYDSKIYKNFIPKFNEGYMGFVEDEEVDENGIVTRVIEHVELPTKIQFGTTGTESEKVLSLLEVLNLNTKNVTNCNHLFRYCKNLKSINTESLVLDKCYDAEGLFIYCQNLTELDLNHWNTSHVKGSIGWLFQNCYSLSRLDISNFDLTNSKNTSSMFAVTGTLTDIGMIYCNKFTVNKVASLLPTNYNTTIWVGEDDILQYDQYDHITYKTQKVQDTVHLNSPLLKGDTIEVIDGKTYHVHRYEKVVLDGSDDEGWSIQTDNYFRTSGHSGWHSPLGYSNYGNYTTWQNIDDGGYGVNYTYCYRVRLEEMNPEVMSLEDFKYKLSQQPLIIIHNLPTPYYELISEEPLELTLLDTTDNTINNNSILPSNMTIANKELSTIAIKPSTTYTLSFDKSNIDSEVTIDICGGEQITTVLNRVELTTPSELGSGIRFISSDGCIISNVRLLEGSLVESAIPKETFEGLKNSFEDGYIIGENLVPIGVNYQSDVTSKATQLKKTIPAGTTMTIIIHTKQACKSCVRACLQLQDKDGAGTQTTYVGAVNNADFAINTGYHVSTVRTLTHDLSYINVWFNQVEGIVEYDEIYILEGDHTHLSEAELMRYIEKGTSHYEEEDYNHVGKYKVQYKVTGKNKFDKNKFLDLNSNYEFMSQNIYRCKSIQLKPNTTYTISKKYADTDLFLVLLNVSPQVNKVPYFDLRDGSNSSTTYTTLDDGKLYIGSGSIENLDTVLDRIQIEEGTTATEYEPYKEDIKTYYLSSPLLEGDTIEDINGVATHVKRYQKVVLDGSESWYNYNITDGYFKCGCNSFRNTLKPGKLNVHLLSDKLSYVAYNINPDIIIGISDSLVSSLTEAIQWLQDNPSTIIYPLASPIYEPISTESILCDSYVNGHLDVNTNIPIEKVQFDYVLLALKYIKPSTRYLLQFESDNVGISTINIGGTTVSGVSIIKGTNKVEITTLSTLNHQLLAFSGIGFNASNIQVVACDEDIEFDYFKGLQSSFENGLVADVNDENYGKYKVECKIVGKNKFDGKLEIGSIASNGVLTDDTRCVRVVDYIKIKPNTAYIISNDKSYIQNIYFYDIDYNCIKTINTKNSFTTPQNCMYIKFRSNITDIQNDLSVKYQLEEGTQATSYEPYKESIHTLYLNSPLLKGDKLVVHEGKLCHYHKKGMVVLDGSENNENYYLTSVVTNNINTLSFIVCMYNDENINKKTTDNIICDIFYTPPHLSFDYANNDNVEMIESWLDSSASFIININKSKLSTQNLDGFKQWLQANPTTVVYELEEPYYEPIEPQISQYSFSTVKDGDMEIITTLPIEIDLTYRTDINGVSSIEEQIASIQESTDISSIIDEEVDE